MQLEMLRTRLSAEHLFIVSGRDISDGICWQVDLRQPLKSKAKSSK